MNSDTQLLLKEIQKLSVEQTTIQKQLSDLRDLLERRFMEVEENLDRRFKDIDAAVEQRIIDSELRQDGSLIAIEQAASDFTKWRQEHEGIIDDLRLRIGKLDKYWNRSVIESAAVHIESAIFPEPPMNRIRQTSSVQDYVDHFSELVDQLTAYDSSTNALHYITRFLDGLNANIHAVLLVQRPDSLDIAYTLALLQEEAGAPFRKHEFNPWNQKGGCQQPPRQDHVQAAAADKNVLIQKPMDKKLADLKAFRHARGLCDLCGEKWNREHKCAAQVGLNVLDELYALFTDEVTEDCPTIEDQLADDVAQICYCLSADNIACSGIKTLQF
ncbi:unnamed protein product [Miscanthus lutarioriparius]|uniref:Retrotransposon protein n=1 Tax=Miscanthus lutarioriparius TaxID=422564 RepID=A0A811QFH0_9POAL|nr:unnamed protein product [Miscanthus lutarioriparius]